ncbi:hypothetical protein K469DRAFT_808442 [Zopfia rhizophila CBS 207.26]|uniref:Uncharacterized protein n=1 Tax=Zopfia rhizophila CBS 207.26 TaxID=1314779 RepID=A0A6A6EJS3_9PEZI|nr:hypothetical protein K469DRAFT_808442 [Zopfia rhizophila CBS 207.26]
MLQEIRRETKEINLKVDRMTLRGNSGDAASTPDTTASSDPGTSATLEQRTVDEQPPENPPTQVPHSAPLLNTSGSSPNAFDSICAASPSKERHYLIPVFQRIKAYGVDTTLIFRISIPDTCLSTMTDEQRKWIRSNLTPMSHILYLLTNYIYGSNRKYFSDTQIEVKRILEDGIQSYARSILPSISQSGLEKRLIELVSLFGRQVSLRSGQSACLRGLYPNGCLIEVNKSLSVIGEGEIVGPADNSMWLPDNRMLTSDMEPHLMQEAAKQMPAGSDPIEGPWWEYYDGTA